MDELIKQAESLGIKVFKSWDEERLKSEIAKVVEANAASSGDHAVAIESVAITVDGDPDQIAKVIAESIAPAIAPDPAEEPEPEPEPEAKTLSEEYLAQIEADNQAALESVARSEYVAPETYITIINLKANPMRALGLGSHPSTVTFTQRQFESDPALEKRVARGVELGLLKVESVE